MRTAKAVIDVDPVFVQSGYSRDGRDERSSHCATGIPERERSDRQTGAMTRWAVRCPLGAQIIKFFALASARPGKGTMVASAG